MEEVITHHDDDDCFKVAQASRHSGYHMVRMTYRIHIGMFPQQLVEPVASLVVPTMVSRE